MKRALDYGHCLSGADTGARGNGYSEEKCTREIGKKVKAGLESLGDVVVEVAPDSASSVNNSLYIRYTAANNSNAQQCISIHMNSGGGHGCEIFTYNAQDVLGASAILRNLANLGFTNRGIKSGNGLAMVKRPSMKAMLIECCFIDSASDMSKYNAQKIAQAIVSGLTGKYVICNGGASSTDSSNEYKVGWNQEADGRWWYAVSKWTYCKNEWKFIDGEWYWFDSEGYTATSTWKYIDNKWYYFDEAGKMRSTQWKQEPDGKWYYLSKDGSMLTNSFVADKSGDGRIYYVGCDGVMKENEEFEAYGKHYTANSDGVCTEVAAN